MASEMDRRAETVANGRDYKVPSLAHWQSLLERRLACREAWQRFSTGSKAGSAFASLGLTAEDLAAIAPAQCSNDIAFVERALERDKRWADCRSLANIDSAIGEIEAFLDSRAPLPRDALR